MGDGANPLVTMNGLGDGYTLTQVVHVAAKLELSDILYDGPKSLEELAKATKTHAPSLKRLLRMLTAIGVVNSTAEDKYEITVLGSTLGSRGESIRPGVLLVGDAAYWRPWGELLHSVRTGQPAFRKVFGEGLYDYLGQHPVASEAFNDTMNLITNMQMTGLLAAYDWNACERVVDLGGGNGVLMAGVLKANSSPHGVVFDLPDVVEGARGVLEKAGVLSRCELVGGNFFKSVPSGGDAYVLKANLQDWDDDKAIDILKCCRRALAPGGKVLVVEQLIVDDNGAAEDTAGTDLYMLVLTGGRLRTEAQFATLFEGAGLQLERVIPTKAGVSIIEGGLS